MTAFSRWPRAVVVYANFYQFLPGQKLQFFPVKSLMVLWSKAGTGNVTVNGQTWALEPGQYVVMPWAHAVRYEAGKDDPFLVGGIHVIPNHQANHRVIFQVAHEEQHTLARAAYRKGLKITELEEVKPLWLEADEPLPYLLEYIVRMFMLGEVATAMAGQWGRELLEELVRARQTATTPEHGLPPELDRMCQYVLTRMHEPVSLAGLVEFSQLSASTVGRLFRAHLGTTPQTWILRTKIERAKTLLQTRRLSVREVGEQVGIADPYYFSKCFKKQTGQSPLQHRRQTPLL